MLERRAFFIRALLWLAGLAVACVALCGAALVAYLMWVGRDLPEPSRIRRHLTMPEAMAGRLCDDCGPVLLCRAPVHVSVRDLPVWLPKVFLITEDATFYQRPRADSLAMVIARVVAASVFSGKATRSSSDLADLTARLLLPASHDGVSLLQRTLLAHRLNRHLRKDEILTLYLNALYFGRNAFGIQSAARVYFGKSAAALTLAQAAALAVQARVPLKDPARHAVVTKRRQMYLLTRLRELDWITSEQFQEAAAEPLHYQNVAR